MSKSLRWKQLSGTSKLYLLGIYAAAVPAAYACLFQLPGTYPASWFILTLASVLVASLSLRLPRISTVTISMGDVFTILALMYFGAGPALITLSLDMVTASISDYSRRHGIQFYRQILLHRFLFNLALSPLAVLPMGLLYRYATNSTLTFPLSMAVGLVFAATAWFLVNTVTLAMAVSLWSNRPFVEVWTNALGLYLLNFFSSAAGAGLISLFFRSGVYTFVFAVPIVFLLYRLYRYHVDEYEQAKAHIAELNLRYEEQVRMREAQSRSEARYRNLVEAASDAIFSLSPDLQITSLNPAFERITGWPIDHWTRRPIEDLLHPLDRAGAKETLGRVLQGETVLFPVLRMSRSSGEYVEVECTLTPHIEGGNVIGLLGIARDMTERKRLEETLRQSQKMEAVGRLAGGVAHDFNNLLVVIIGYSEMLEDSMAPGDRTRTMVGEIRKAAERAASLTRQLLAFSRKQIVQPVALDLNGVVSNMDPMLRRLIGEDIELINVLAPSLGTVRADPGQIEQIILNMAVNSRDAMPSGGRLTIRTGNADNREVLEAVKTQVAAGDYVMLSVTDTGSGIPEDIRHLIFDPFFTTKQPGKGTGLGLATVYGIVHQSGGYLSVESRPGETSFKIFFPRIREQVKSAEAERPVSRVTARETIMLVEDEDAVRALTSAILRRHGYVVLEARSGEEAIMLCRDHTGPIDALVTDVVMPRMSGREVAEAIKALRQKIRVLYVSGYTDDIISHHGVLDPGTAFLQKPFSPDGLAHKVQELLHPHS